MKKSLLFIVMIICIAVGVCCLTACNQTNEDWLLPEFSMSGEGYSVELTTNIENDFEFPIGGLKLDHGKISQEMLEYCWVIYDGNNEIAGWIEISGGYSTPKKGQYKYGFAASTSNGVYGYGKPGINLVLRGTDTAIFDSITMTSDIGSISKSGSAASATERYSNYDEAENVMRPYPNSGNFVFCSYELDIEGIKPSDISSVIITVNLNA